MTLFVETAVTNHHISYPVLLDNQQQNWERFANKAWPTKYLVDSDGYIRFVRQGEGYYQETEQAIQILLRQYNPDVVLPDPLPALRPEDAPGAICYRPTPELYAGYQGGGLFAGALGNPEGYFPQTPMFYTLPPAEERKTGQIYVDGPGVPGQKQSLTPDKREVRSCCLVRQQLSMAFSALPQMW